MWILSPWSHGVRELSGQLAMMLNSYTGLDPGLQKFQTAAGSTTFSVFILSFLKLITTRLNFGQQLKLPTNDDLLDTFWERLIQKNLSQTPVQWIYNRMNHAGKVVSLRYVPTRKNVTLTRRAFLRDSFLPPLSHNVGFFWKTNESHTITNNSTLLVCACHCWTGKWWLQLFSCDVISIVSALSTLG